jgi:hypothetical protein
MNLHRESKIHPEILWIAINLILHPNQRDIYPAVVLALADDAIEIIKNSLLSD